MKIPLIIEQHFHGAFGVDFNTAKVDEILFLADKLKSLGIGYFFPTLVTDNIENIKRQISTIKQAAKNCSSVLGIHLEGIFINKDKKGIHNPKYFLPLTVENYKQIEDDFIKIVTLAPELDEGLTDYLHKKNVKVQAGHCVGWGNVDGVTHTFNAMSGISHRSTTTALKSLVDDNVYSEIIADGIHVNDDTLELFFRAKKEDKIILISDALPITYSDIKETIFADSKIYYDGEKATSADGTIAGSTKLLPDIIRRLIKKNLFKPQYVENVYKYHNMTPKEYIDFE